jgi:hypothetical protein
MIFSILGALPILLIVCLIYEFFNSRFYSKKKLIFNICLSSILAAPYICLLTLGVFECNPFRCSNEGGMLLILSTMTYGIIGIPSIFVASISGYRLYHLKKKSDDIENSVGI